VTAFVYEWERYLEGKVQIFGVSVEPPEEGKKFLERVTGDCQEDRPHIPLDPYPVRLLSDPDATLIRAVGTANEGHWAGTIAAPVTYVLDPGGKVSGPTPAKVLRTGRARWRLPKPPARLLRAKSRRRTIRGKREPGGQSLSRALQLSLERRNCFVCASVNRVA